MSSDEDGELTEKGPKSLEEETASAEKSYPFAVTAYENADKPNVKVCVLFHVGGVSCDELNSIHLCPLPGTGASKELVKRRVIA